MNELIEVIESYNQYMKNIAPGSLAIAEHLRNDEIGDGLKMILQFSEGMSWITEASELLQKNNVQVTLDVSQIHEFLQEINNGLEVQDYVLVADMFEYEIAPFFENVAEVESIEQ